MKLSDLTCGTIISIADDLGCNVPMYSMEINRLLGKLMKDSNLSENKKFMAAFNKEQDRCAKVNDKLFDDYMESICDWLYEKGYIDAEGRFVETI